MTALPTMTLQDLIARVRSASLIKPEAADTPPTAPVPAPPPPSAPPPPPPRMAAVTLPPLEGWEQSGLRWDEALLAAPEAEWLDLAYRVVLGRPADAAGEAHYRAEQTRHGSRYWVMFAMRASPEAESVGRPLSGLRLARLLLLIGRIGLKLRLGKLSLTPLRRLERRTQKPFRMLIWLRQAQFAQQQSVAEAQHNLELALHSHTIALQAHGARLDDYFQILQRHSGDVVRLESARLEAVRSLEALIDQAAFFDRRVSHLADDYGRFKRRSASNSGAGGAEPQS